MVLILPRRRPGLSVADVFSTDLWTGNGSTQSITNGLDLSGEGGLVWVKARSSGDNNLLFDTERGALDRLISNGTFAESTLSNSLTSFNSDGFSLGSYISVNQSATTYAGWSFRKAPKFFDVVTYTGDGSSSLDVSHNLGTTPGLIVTKRTDSAGNWGSWHNSFGTKDVIQLNATTAKTNYPSGDAATIDGNKFTVGTNQIFGNGSGWSYVAYLFAHDDSSNGLIQCGSYTGNGSSSGPTVTLGWEPQWLMIKRTDGSGDWFIFDSARGMVSGSCKALYPNVSAAEDTYNRVNAVSTGFEITASDANINASGGSYIYVAIRKED